MRRNRQQAWPESVNVNIRLDTAEQGLARTWVDRFLKELACVLDPHRVGTPEQSYQEVITVARRWLTYELAARERERREIPKVRAFTVTYFAERDQRGEKLAVIDVLSGRVTS